MLPFVRRGTSRALAPCALVVLGGLVSGCGDLGPGRAQPPERPDEVGRHQGEVCPPRLAQREQPGHGFGTDERATESPSLVAPDSAWVCRYDPVDAGPGPGGDGMTLEWELAAPPREVPQADLERIVRHLAELEPAAAEQACTADLGPRWMLVHVVESDLTGVVVDDFGCRDVRLTDEPFETPPGDASQADTVSGVLWGPEELLADLKRVAARP